MKSKLNTSKTPFLRRNNYIGSLSNSQAMEFGELVSQISKGTNKDTIRVYPRDKKDGKEDVQSILKYFGSKYPYKNIGWVSPYVRYVLKDKKDRDSALNAMKLALNYYNINRITIDNKDFDPLDPGDAGGTGDNGGTGSNNNTNNSNQKNSDSSKEESENDVMSFITNPVNIIIILALLVGVYFLLKK